MTSKAQAYYLVKVVGNIDGPFKEWEDKIFKKVAREMELQFGKAAEVSRYQDPRVDPADAVRSSIAERCPGCGSTDTAVRLMVTVQDSHPHSGAYARECVDPWHGHWHQYTAPSSPSHLNVAPVMDASGRPMKIGSAVDLTDGSW